MTINLTGLYPQAYEHPEDATALNLLEHTAGLDLLVRKVNAWGLERMLRIQMTGSFMCVTAESFPDLYKLFLTARDRIALPITPEFYIKNEEDINAFSAGVEKPAVVVNSGTVDRLREDELLFILGHELGHIKSGHVLYYQIASYLPVIGSLLGDLTLGLGGFFSMGLQVALLHWQRTSELTADRAGLLTCQNSDAALRAMMKLAGLPEKYSETADVKHFIEQAKQFESFDMSKLDKVAKYLSIYGSNHPWTVMRAKEMLTWIYGGGYQRVLDMTAIPVAPQRAIRRFCDQDGTEALPGEAFCRVCGRPLPSAV